MQRAQHWQRFRLMSVQNSRETPVADRDARAREIRDALARKLVELSDGKLAQSDIDPAGHLVDHGYVDSLSAVSFLAHVEERYGVRIDDLEVIEKFWSLDRIVAHLLAEG
jgi:acyl carrier protein